VGPIRVNKILAASTKWQILGQALTGNINKEKERLKILVLLGREIVFLGIEIVVDCSWLVVKRHPKALKGRAT
jgi:hypothetical protein